MEKTQKIIIGLTALIIILAGSIFVLTQMQNVEYDRIEIVPNGTSIEMVNKNTVYNDTTAKKTGLKTWTCDYGTLNTYNSAETTQALGFDSLAGAVAFKALNETINQYTTATENIDGITVKTVENMNSKFGDTMYAVYIVNPDTHDNIIIFMNNKDIAIHMAKSIQYKVSNYTAAEETGSDAVVETPNTNTTIKNLTLPEDDNEYDFIEDDYSDDDWESSGDDELDTVATVDDSGDDYADDSSVSVEEEADEY